MKNTKKSITYARFTTRRLAKQPIMALLLISCLFLGFTNNSQAKSFEMNFFDWTLFKTNRGDRYVCYLVSTPIKKAGYSLRRGEPYFLVSNSQNDGDEVTVSSGYVYKASADVEVSFGPKKFFLFPHYGVSWAFDTNDDLDIIKEMQRNPELTVVGTTIYNKVTFDTYSLLGFSKAYLKLKELCNDE